MCVAPNTGLNVFDPAPNSGVFVLPSVIAPAARMRVTISASFVGTLSLIERRAERRADSRRCGRDPCARPAARAADRADGRCACCSSAFAASAIARSATSVTIALIFGLTRSMRARCAAMTSRAETCFWRMRRASSIAVSAQSSSPEACSARWATYRSCPRGVGMGIRCERSGSTRLTAAAPRSWLNARRVMGSLISDAKGREIMSSRRSGDSACDTTRGTYGNGKARANPRRLALDAHWYPSGAERFAALTCMLWHDRSRAARSSSSWHRGGNASSAR